MRLLLLLLLSAGPALGQTLGETRPVERPTLHVVSVGINAYPDFHLRGAVNDAVAVDSALAAVGAPFFERVERRLLLDSEATAENVEGALRGTADAAQREDTVVLFFAGVGIHGTVAEEFGLEAADFYLIPAGVSMQEGPFILAQHLGRWLAEIPAQRLLVIIDACSEQAAADRLARTLLPANAGPGGRSLVVIAPEGIALEVRDPLSERTHGELTLALLDRLGGAADANGDGATTAHEIGAALPVALNEGATPIRVEASGPDFALGATPGGRVTNPGPHFGSVLRAIKTEWGQDHDRAHLARLHWAAAGSRVGSVRGGRIDATVRDLETRWGPDDPRLAVPLALQALAGYDDALAYLDRIRFNSLGAGQTTHAAVTQSLERARRLLQSDPDRNPLVLGAATADLARLALSGSDALRDEADTYFREAAVAPQLPDRARKLAASFVRTPSTPPSGEEPPASERGPSAPEPPRWPYPVAPGPDIYEEPYLGRVLMQRLVLPEEPPDLRLRPIVTDSSVVVLGRVLDEQGALSAEVDGRPVELTPSGEFAFAYPLGAGATTYTIRATDAGGATVERALTVERPTMRSGDVEEPEALLPPRRDLAVFFATDRYEDGRLAPLTNAIADAEAVAALLHRRHGFDTLVVRNPTKNEIERTLYRYRDYVFGDDEDSQLFVFVSGHGQYIERYGEGYIQATDADRSDVTTTIPMSVLANRLDAMTNFDRILLVLDVCYGGDVFRSSRSGGDLYDDKDRVEVLRSVAGTRSRLALTSGGVERVADGAPGRHSPFAARVLDALEHRAGEDRLLFFDELAAEVRKVNGQTPQAGTFGRGGDSGSLTFVFVEQDE